MKTLRFLEFDTYLPKIWPKNPGDLNLQKPHCYYTPTKSLLKLMCDTRLCVITLTISPQCRTLQMTAWLGGNRVSTPFENNSIQACNNHNRILTIFWAKSLWEKSIYQKRMSSPYLRFPSDSRQYYINILITIFISLLQLFRLQLKFLPKQEINV